MVREWILAVHEAKLKPANLNKRRGGGARMNCGNAWRKNLKTLKLYQNAATEP